MKPVYKGNHSCPILYEDGGDYRKGCYFTQELLDEDPAKKGEGINEHYAYKTKISFMCPPLQKLIDEGKAKISVLLQQDTLRRALQVQDGICTIKVFPYELKLEGRNIVATPIIIATKEFDLSYDEEYMESIYGGFSDDIFHISNGQILGYGNPVELSVTRTAGTSAIAYIKVWDEGQENKNIVFDVNLDGPRIVILMSKELKDSVSKLTALQYNLGYLVNASIEYPVIMRAICALMDDRAEESYGEYGWAIALKNKITEIEQQRGNGSFDDVISGLSSTEKKQRQAWEWTCLVLKDDNGHLLSRGIIESEGYEQEED